MKIYAVSDLHGNLDGMDPVDADVVVIAGDLAPMKGWSVWHINDQVKCTILVMTMVRLRNSTMCRV